jgi:hypothetical protein
MNTNTSNDVVFDDAFFQEYAEGIKEEQSKKGGSGGGYTREFEDVAYAACEPGKNKIFRMVGIPPKAKNVPRRNWDPKEVIMSDIKADDGKRFTLKLPPREDVASKNHIIHRLYDRINEVAWVNKQKVMVNEAQHPELLTHCNKMGFTPQDGDISYKSAAGLKGSKYIVQNVIDRHDDWCAEHKHTKILANSVNIDDKGRVWGKAGIKEFGYIDKLADLIAKYKMPDQYDIAIKRIAGAKTAPWELRNASLYAEKDLMEELKNDDGTLPPKEIIVSGPLTEAEKNYEHYDLDKFYGPTTYQTIAKRIPSIFKECDAALHTKFYDELTALVEQEKKMFEEMYRKNEADTAKAETAAVETAVAQEPTPEPVQESAPVAHRTNVVGPVETELSEDKIAALKGWGNLTDDQKTLISDVIFDTNGKVKDIKWVPCSGTENLLACDCGIASPENWASCPVCGAKFI